MQDNNNKLLICIERVAEPINIRNLKMLNIRDICRKKIKNRKLFFFTINQWLVQILKNSKFAPNDSVQLFVMQIRAF